MEQSVCNSADSSPSGLIIPQLRSDPLYCEFLDDDFDAKTVAAKAVENLAITDNLAKISAGISLVEREIRHEVGDKYEQLLSHATDIEVLEKSLQDTFTSVKALKVISDRLQSRMNECYTKVEQQTLMLGRLHETCELARSVARLAGICKQLRQSNSKQNKDMIKSAQLIAEVDHLLSNVGDGVHSVNAVRQHLTFLSEFRVDLIRQCQNLLKSSLETQNAAQIAIALQSLHHMGILSQQLEWLLQNYREKNTRAAKEALDSHRLTQNEQAAGRAPGRVALGGGAAFRGNLWNAIENLTGAINAQLAQVAGLETVMAKRKDAISHATFLQIYSDEGKPGLVESLWEDLSAMLSEELVSASSQSTFVRQAFEGEYPKLIKIFTTKLEGVDLAKLRLEVLETAYLSRSLSRLLDSANLCLTNTPPSQEDVLAVVNVIMSEIRVTESVGDSQLLHKVAKNVAKTVHHLASRAEETVIKSSTPDAIQVIGPANVTQKNNGIALQLLNQFSVQVASFTESLTCDATSISVMSSSLKHIDSTLTSSLAPLFSSIGNAIEAIFLTMHGERYDIKSNGEKMSCSLYMRELTGFMQRVISEYVILFPVNGTVQGMVREMGSRTIELFLRFATLLRPVSDGGCLKLAADCCQLETILSQLNPESYEDSLGRQFRSLRALKPLLLQEEEQIAKSPSVGSVVPYSTVLHFLFARAPPEMKSPHEAASWSLQKYSSWLDQHPSEKDRLVLIRGTLDSYLRWVKQNSIKQFPPVYLLINELLAKAVADCV
ncbi:conserved oligomeric Golgi complex subunit 5 [Galendromus occidentalis]|uniref:Conserved oligomeric Golgi complex subunit 5 n=1 Tax=Galendromus occidentalis TaxID=34638 RepID=A0AAJ6VVQ0_9ACAR|nr:conserved oligomeric Golgi complex subunit 5 [Galendromus occidentalis]